MGNLINKDEQELTQSLKGDYQTQSHPFLLHRQSQKICLLHKITTNSDPNSKHIKQIIEQYSHSKCNSISNLKAWHHLDRKGYCSDQQTYYLIFEGQNSYTLKDELNKRRFYQQPFSESEIRSVIETYLCGLRQYHNRFERTYQQLSLSSLIIDQPTQKIYLRDPWLGHQPQSQNTHKMTHIMHSYPSPQKLNSLLSPRVSSYNEFLSHLFSIGVISLELKRLDFADGIYSKKKQINYQQIARRIGEFRDQKLRNGVEVLLSMDASARKQIYSIWGIQNKEEHFLMPFFEDNATREKPQLGPRIDTKKSYDDEPPRDLTKTNQITFNTIHQQRPQYRPNSQLQTSVHHNPSRPNLKLQPVDPVLQSSRRQKSDVNTSMHLSKPIINFSRPNSQVQMKINPAAQNQHNSMRPLQSSVYHPPSIPQSQPVTMTQSAHHQNQVKFEHKPIRINPPSTQSQFNLAKPGNFNSQYQPNVQPFAKKPQEHKKFMSFKDFMNEEPSCKTSQEHNTRPGSTDFQQRSQNIQFQSTSLQKRPNNSINPQIFGQHKESYTFFEPPPHIEQHRKQSQQTVTESPSTRQKPSPINLVSKQIDRLAESPPSEPKETLSSPPKQLIRKDNKEESPQLAKQETKVKEQFTLLIKQKESQPQQQEQPQSQDTPKRPPSKNKFNSTIVEVHDEQTPEHSNKSDEAEGEYIVEQYQTGSKYEGFKSNGMRNGQGKFYYQDGGHYEGHWKNNKMDGYGKLYYEGGKLAYQGNWAQDQFDGIGKVYNDNPITLVGSFDYTNFDYLEDYWEYYEGMLSKDSKEGRGRIKLSNGEVFEGDFHQDKIQGVGKFHSLEGKVVEGMWRDSKLVKVIRSD